jgi:hypothetical protein
MSHLKMVPLFGVVVALAGASWLAASAPTQVQTQAQTQAQTPGLLPPSAPPPAARPNPTPPPAAASAGSSAPAPRAADPMLRMVVFSSDGSKVGTVQSVSSAPDGAIKGIHIRTGGFLGFGTRLVAIPEGRFTRNGNAVQLGLTAYEVSKLPELKEQS